MADETEKTFIKLLGIFWEKNLEPVLTSMNNEIKKINNKLDDLTSGQKSLETKLDDLTLEVKSQGRKLDSEVNYRDNLEKRVQTLEKSH